MPCQPTQRKVARGSTVLEGCYLRGVQDYPCFSHVSEHKVVFLDRVSEEWAQKIADRDLSRLNKSVAEQPGIVPDGI